ncbi:MAG TPA: TonB-dependent receptor [Povalibacter sp.]|uniref:TonB-dependent receptor plug domain-containing protein n=1 Tax=Povalibacter sp. TaxID=1962978 RepID=UPI002BFA0108|nr:TonB-dependent receptor [Povalibacter sp.]HMN43186.1 TonB-dependent receptor [Povalibacter sp.]
MRSIRLAVALSLACTVANAATTADAPDEQVLEAVIVTGSRIARPELESAMPINVISMDQMKDFGRLSVYDALVLNPAVGPGLGEFNSGGTEYDKGVANINLRQLGTNRSLVVVDGHRWVSGGARIAAVDLNTIPSALIDRIETVTGGAAAIYGADAVTGAINVIMKKKVERSEVSLISGISDQSDASQTQFSAVTGFSFADDRANVVLGGNFTKTDPVMLVDRHPDYYTYIANPANTGPNDGIPDNILGTYRQFYRSHYPTFCIQNNGTAGCNNSSIRDGNWYQLIGNQVVNIPKNYYTVVTGGETGQQNWTGPADYDTGTGLFDNLYQRDKSEKGSFYGNLEFQLTPDITWNTTLGYAYAKNSGVAQWPEYRDDVRPTNWWAINGVGTTGEIARLTDPYLPESLRSFMLANSLTSIPLDRHYLNLPAPTQIDTRHSYTVGTDLAGPLTERIDWNAYARYGQVTDDIDTINMVGAQQWRYSRNAVLLDGQVVCADAAARAAGCVPFNYYTTDAPSQAWNDYALFTRHEKTENSLLSAGAGLSGSVLTWWAGDVSVAAGVEWREEKLRTRDDPDTTKLANIVFSPGNDNALHPAMDASRKVSEAYAEVVVPLLKDLPVARKLQVEGAYRYSDYSDNASTDTWKYGLTWAPVQGVTLRGVKSYSTRVPNFGELYAPINTITLGHISDPCQASFILQDSDRAANCAATVPGWTGPLPNPNLNAPRYTTGGNPDLEPETSDSYTYGIVLQPAFLPGLDVTADYWNIRIDDVITSLSYTNIMNSCVNASGGPDMGYCQFVHRFTDTTADHNIGEVNLVQSQYANLAGRDVRGIDYSARYGFLLGAGKARIGFNGTRLLEQTTISQVGANGTDSAGAWNYPHFHGTLTLGYDIGAFAFGVNTTFISKSRFSATDQSDETRQRPYVPAYFKHDVNFAWRATEALTASLGVKNVTDNFVDHPALQVNVTTTPHLSEGGPSSAAYYDMIGRYYFATVKYGF